MVECVVKNWQGEAVGQATLELRVAKETSASHVVHRALIKQLTNARQGTANTKTRAEVRGGGRKPWRQKGTGRARAGSIRSPLWRGGGVTFGPKPRTYNLKMNRKEELLALRTAFASRADDMVVVEDFAEQISQPKTKEMTAAIARWGIDPGTKVLLIVAEETENVYLSARNIAKLTLISADELNVYDILNADTIVATSSALNMIQEVYSA
ncbi:MAG: 50S ribosomal protein L4 [Chroococcidiopsis cubana SAG 39.79]|jgi:large subunit ribosomal protein L4|uniref:Large ribosomal subunit protein uL4 n=2 Tax=Chroococcidiopsis TaxID=54298 RepID=K9TT75_CHRTP|nr:MULTISPECIES: 50S ribosomal protein L4 [Chroococcidiopsis]PSB47668.1 50S ribosomal protein L4 [Cyanosarcina cf. burmensis CCALA 770]AFY85750.1 LSU ribosomal protein L4P [Chroococcidiopsis thermalis PCC 7203]MDZ4872949.1 50S ribosomal protein L4 [Chroococcidiopsis cubana SAG 39.79]PSB64771.1 50S ribosomal protein L4 [Chroococcidiopsis cubana CCALA 043]RUT12734.1 50S ribosomal protein L4 [Chroococcidiopsis cubana SAG 39.79]